MPTNSTKTALTETMTKPEVCEYLGKSKRTVETFVSRGRLGVSYVQGGNGRTASFRRADVEALRLELDTPTFRAVPVATTQMSSPAPTAVQTYSAASADPLAALAALLNREPQTPKPWLTLDEAVTMSGLTRMWLLNEAAISRNFNACNTTEARKPLVAIRDMGKGARGGRWRFSREALAR